jgi:hydroxymethylbilane synthase
VKWRIATRGSALALWQANHVRDHLLALDRALEVELLVLKTRGDKILDRALSEVGGKGLFVKEIEEALLDGRAELAVHSMKDLPAELSAGLMLGAVPIREDPRDALVVRPGLRADSIRALPRGARVGTSSLRRLCQLKALRPDVEVVPLRGNVDTRLSRLDAGDLDAAILACAGLIRIGRGDRIAAALSIEESLPAVGQGALAIECRSDDTITRVRLQALEHAATRVAIEAERAFLSRLGGGCQTPLGALATLTGEQLVLEGFVGEPDGRRLLRQRAMGTKGEAEDLGLTVAERLLSAGADEILRNLVPTQAAGAP